MKEIDEPSQICSSSMTVIEDIAPTVAPDVAQSRLPQGIHIVVVVYGAAYAKLLAEITLANLAALVREIPQELRGKSVLRILTTASDKSLIETSASLGTLRKILRVEILDKLRMGGFDKYGGYGPMVETQRDAVIEAAKVNAALFFVGPDQIYSRGSFASFIERLNEGYRVIVGPGVRINRDAARPALLQRIAASDDGSLSLSPTEQIDLFFRHWHPVNDQFVIGSEAGILWKAYIYHRPDPNELLIRFFQGPTLVAWPRNGTGFEGFVDHDLVLHCCSDKREIYVIADGVECLALDMTDDARRDVQNLARFPRVDLLRELFNHRAIKDMQLRYGLRTCRIHRGDRRQKDVERGYRQLARAVDPLIFLALTERFFYRRLGPKVSSAFRIFAVLNVSTLSLLLGLLMPRWSRR